MSEVEVKKPVEVNAEVQEAEVDEDARDIPVNPMTLLVEKLKKDNPDNELHLIDVGIGRHVIYKGMNRVDFKNVRKYQTENPNMTDEEFEDYICDTFVVHPSGEEYRDMKRKMGGFSTTMSEAIYRSSGFVPLNLPTKL